MGDEDVRVNVDVSENVDEDVLLEVKVVDVVNSEVVLLEVNAVDVVNSEVEDTALPCAII
jgi:hypothetical protein